MSKCKCGVTIISGASQCDECFRRSLKKEAEKPIKKEKPKAFLWSTVSPYQTAWRHIHFLLVGKADYVACKECNEREGLQPVNNFGCPTTRPRQSIAREFARRHFYKHKIGVKLYEEAKNTEIKAAMQSDLPVLLSVAQNVVNVQV